MPITYSHSGSPEFGTVRSARFTTNSQGLEEVHLCVEAPSHGNFAEQLTAVEALIEKARQRQGLDDNSVVFRRVFLSDAANQTSLVEPSHLSARAESPPVAISILEQPPISGSKLCVWEYYVQGTSPLDKHACPHGATFTHAGRKHIWTAGMATPLFQGSGEQTLRLLREYETELAPFDATLRDHTVRTWFFVSDIDTEYGALVEARKHYFEAIGLTPETHYVTSTGIAGRRASTSTRVLLDAYAVSGLSPEQVHYLTAPQHLGPTHLYGVTFERGTSITYGDRRHIYLSGTASIDPSGKTLHVGDVSGQCHRAFANLEALLANAGARLSNLVQLIAYLRDPADGPLVTQFLERSCPNVPRVVLHAPVCRTNWLVEFEGIALLDHHDRNLEAF